MLIIEPLVLFITLFSLTYAFFYYARIGTVNGSTLSFPSSHLESSVNNIDAGIKDPRRGGYCYTVIDDNSCMRTMLYPGVNGEEVLLTSEEYIEYLEGIVKGARK